MFFHLSAKSKGIRNQIDRILVGGNLFEEEEEIRDQATVYFLNLLQSSSAIPEETLFDMARPPVSFQQNKLLLANPSSTETREAVFRLKKNNSLGHDGFPGPFFTNCWHIVGSDVNHVVPYFFTSGRILRETNAYFLSLIPKSQS